LAWLGSVVNGFNGQSNDMLTGKTIHLMADVNMDGYKWMPLNSCQSYTFLGHNHTISGLNINEQLDEIGMFGYTYNATIRDLHFRNARVRGHEYVGTIIGRGEDINLFNCSVDGSVRAYSYAGGMLGWIQNPRVDSCSIAGTIHVEFLEGGGIAGDLIDYIYSGLYYMRNCYSRCSISGTSCISPFCGGNTGVEVENCYANSSIDAVRFSSGLLGSTSEALIRNCYTTLHVLDPYGYMVEGGSPVALVVGHNYSIEAENVYFPAEGVLPMIAHNYEQDGWGQVSFTDMVGYDYYSPQQDLTDTLEIGYETCTTLLQALNAWVDANDIDGRYCHWKADTKNSNGGYPVLVWEKGDVTTDMAINKTAEQIVVRKVLRNGQFLIIRGDKVYTTTGQRVR
jgi:hypothetical protein